MMMLIRHAKRPVIARRLANGRSRAAVSKTLARLEQRGLLTRSASPTDRRAALVQLTAEGERVADTVFPQQLAVEAELLAGIDPQRRAQIIDGLNALVSTLEEQHRNTRECPEFG